ncbi:Flp pilus assembly protein CpaB [Terrihabitans soli]|uniref:Flp pilus assembly protein CpaB n=1 Tax=Terrihabitans soli TaxID=708113 RepID=A0A6S6QNE2_9HYPH|nr:Flp pilus assembly protein CpaB [Terrihabitans soli]BCJ92034.1 Flp pilus assembly protein CpaB [Terrihabitans soli]
MKFARIAVLAIALLAGGIAMLLVSGGDDAPAPAPQVVQEAAPTAEVLIAAQEIPMGSAVTAESLSWREWPLAGAEGFITKSSQPEAINDIAGAIARQPIVQGEPIRMQKIVKADGSGFMSAILPAGMRAVATEISAETGAGGFILPNDRVDVILTRKDDGGATGEEAFSSSTILTNVRVLAIDQATVEQDGQKVVVGRTATLELLPRQTEILALARQLGTMSLALRSLSDSNPALAGQAPEDRFGRKDAAGAMTVIRYGVPKQE